MLTLHSFSLYNIVLIACLACTNSFFILCKWVLVARFNLSLLTFLETSLFLSYPRTQMIFLCEIGRLHYAQTWKIWLQYNWHCSLKPHVWLAIITWLLIHMAPWYLPLVTKNDIVVNAIYNYALHDCKTSSMAKI
jgi:hypothetical protein